MALVSPDYVQGNYSVADRDRIFAKADKYPDSAGALQNQVPTIMPDGSIGWRQVPEGGDGTANANIAVVEQTNIASKEYNVGDLLIYNGQLYWVTQHIAAGAELLAIEPARVDLSMLSVVGKGKNLFRNWYFDGGGNPFPINQRGVLSYTNPGGTIDGWNITGGTLTVDNYYLIFEAPAGSDAELYQIIETPLANVQGRPYTVFPFVFTVVGSGQIRSGVNYSLSTDPTTFYEDSMCRLSVQKVDNTHIRANIHVFAGKTIFLNAAKLEYGVQQTLAKTSFLGGLNLLDPPPDYQTELLRCSDGFTPVVGKGINLLDNAYFIGGGTAGKFPVNQKNATSYNATGAICIDRWVLNQNTLSLTAAGLKANTGSSINLIQYFEDERIDDGQTYTLSVLTDTGCVSVSAVLDKSATPSSGWQMSTTTGNGAWAGLRHDPGKWHLRLTTSSDSTVIKAIKLELGTQQTLAHQENGSWVLNDPAPNYAEELAKCQRYLWLEANVSANSYVCANGVANTTTSAIFTLFLPQNLRESGNATLIANSVAVYSNTNNSTRNCTAVSIASLLGNNVGISATISGATPGESVRLVVVQGGSFGISKEL